LSSSTDSPDLTPRQRRRKNRLERLALVLVVTGLAVLTLVQREVIELGPGFSDNQGLLALLSINVSVLLITLLILLILRSLYRIFFEKQGYGSLQTKMVIAFICLSLLPTLLIFYYSYRQLVLGHESWFSSRIEDSLSDALDLSGAMMELDDRLLAGFGGDLRDEYLRLPGPVSLQSLQEFLEGSRHRFHLATVEFYSRAGQLAARAGAENLPPIYHGWFADQLRGQSRPPWVSTLETESGDLTRLVFAVTPPEAAGADPEGFLAVGRLTLTPIRSRMEDVRHDLLEYQDKLANWRPFRTAQLTALTSTAILAVFISVWIGSHLAGSLARPVLELVRGTQKVAAGDLDFTLTPPGRSGEFVELVQAFNLMTANLKSLYAELDSRRRFLETVLKNVSTGVMVLNVEGRLLHLNQAAAAILLSDPGAESLPEEAPPADAPAFTGPEDFVLPPPLADLLAEVIHSPLPARRVVERHVRLSQGSSVLSLKVSLTSLRDEEQTTVGYLLAFDDLTELEKAQRLAAWREVARRIAHEVKNPLTPIQLAAQRLRRRFADRLAGESDAAVFEECTAVIIRQVEEMKNLVDEFSRFARLPEIKPVPGDFTDFLTASLALFRQAHKKVNFQLEVRSRPPVFAFDPEQMRRVLTNVLDNAVTAMNEEGRVTLTLEVDDLAGLRLTIADTGPGLDQQIRDHLFDPHVSTKAGGQGLGLAIVRTIVSDHGGFVKARSRPGGGARFIIELPLRQL
jgi:two-component system nitrogen regulation sensor histidine kinase NtrY